MRKIAKQKILEAVMIGPLNKIEDRIDAVVKDLFPLTIHFPNKRKK